MRHSSLLTAALIATLAVGLTGCSRNPVAPTIDTTVAPVAGTMGVSLDPEDAPPVDGGTPLMRTVALDITAEGVITVGRFSLEVRKNSLKNPVTITLWVTDPEALEVQMEVSPPGADFQSPLILTANMSDVQDFDYETGTMLGWDNGNWVELDRAAAHPNQQNVVGQLDHAATCKVGTGGGKKNKIGA
jgi:hypothetical protein